MRTMRKFMTLMLLCVAAALSAQNAEYISFTQPASSPTASPKPTTLPTGRIAVILVNGSGSKIQQANTTTTMNAIEPLDTLVNRSCGTIIKVLQTNGQYIGVSIRNIAQMTPTSGTNTGCTITINGYTAGVKTNTSYSSVAASILSCYGGGGGGDNIYNSDGTITDPDRTVDVDGKNLYFLNANNLGMSGDNIYQTVVPSLYPFGTFQIANQASTGGPIMSASDGAGNFGFVQAVISGNTLSGDSSVFSKNTGVANTGSKLVFRRVNSSGNPRWFGIRAGNGLLGNYTWILPETTPTNGQLLSVTSFNSSTGEAQLGYANGGGSGTVTSVGLSMPSAFSVSGSPVTGAGTLAVTATGTTAQYIRGDGTLATLPADANTNWSNSSLTANGSYTQNGNQNSLTVSNYNALEMRGRTVTLRNSTAGIGGSLYLDTVGYASIGAFRNETGPASITFYSGFGPAPGNEIYFTADTAYFERNRTPLQWNSAATGSGTRFGMLPGLNANYNITWPAAQGGAGTVLTNDGSGNLTWGSGGGGSVDSSNIVASGVSLADLSAQIRNRLPLEGANTNTMYHNGTNWLPATNLLNDGTLIGIGTAPATNYRLRINGTGSTSSTWSLQTRNSAGTETFSVRDDGRATINNAVEIYSRSTTQQGSVVNASTITNNGMFIAPTGTGALVADIPDAAATGGNARGNNAVDLQMVRAAATQAATGAQSFIGAGNNNTSSGTNSAVVAGTGNTASNLNAFVGAGTGNTASASGAIVTGGSTNTASGSFSFIGGGSTVNAGNSFASVVNGSSCNASSTYSLVAGGSVNTASTGNYATVINGNANNVSGAESTVVNGNNNVVTRNNSIVSGASNNTSNGASGAYVTIFGLGNNFASGSTSIAHTTMIGSGNQCNKDHQFATGVNSRPVAYAEQARSLGNTGPIAGQNRYAGLSVIQLGGHGVGTGTFELFADYSSNIPAERIPIPSNSALTAQVSCTAAGVVTGGTVNVGDTGHAIYLFGAKNVAGTSSATTVTTDMSQATGGMAGITWTINVDDATDTLRVQVTPPPGANVSTQINATCQVNLTWQYF